jgi:hypothetical protein
MRASGLMQNIDIGMKIPTCEHTETAKHRAKVFLLFDYQNYNEVSL